MIQSMVAIANGQFWGRGLGHGLQKFGYLPEDQTDFIFAIICEELGVPGACVVVALYLGLLWSAYAIIRKQTIPILKFIAIGITATVGIQAIINLAVVTGLGPTKGIALPLLSSGGTGWILTAASLGLLVAMDRFADARAARELETIEPAATALPASTIEAKGEPTLAPIGA
jgi:cell division protein FtsW